MSNKKTTENKLQHSYTTVTVVEHAEYCSTMTNNDSNKGNLKQHESVSLTHNIKGPGAEERVHSILQCTVPFTAC